MTKFACVIGLVAVLVALAPGVRVQAQAIDPFTMRAVKTASPPTVDGVVDANEWRDAARVTDFIQFEPNRGEPSKFKTEVTVLYDDAHLYVAFVAHDPEPVMGQMTQRDAELWNDDSVQVYLDTFHDGRSGYFFMTNVLGTQLDGRLAEDGMTSDNTWDAPWVSVTQQPDFGY
ncbi:MAG: carbohydrate binding family 9 domain-containing protein, partial [Vicinamibacterales bacterium]|nr:carbohydrate binding family 9 domain-containing protein [Vicinamibacterales bacterium]